MAQATLPTGTTVAVFDDPSYVDTAGGTDSESDNIQASLQQLGARVVTFTDIVAATSTSRILLFPELEKGDLASGLSSVARVALHDFVAAGGCVITCGDSAPRSSSLLNTVFGFSLSELAAGEYSALMAQAAATSFAGGPSALPKNNGTSALAGNTLPAGSVSVYEWSGVSVVVLMRIGSGKVLFLGWDWFDAKPRGAQDGGWLGILGRAVAEVAPSSPAISTQPSGQAVGYAATATFQVLATGATPLSYQWLKDGVCLSDGGRLSGTRAPDLTISSVQFADEGGYNAVITNQYGAVTSLVATLTLVYDLQQPLVTNGLAGYYPLDGNADDTSGNRNNGFNLGAGFAGDRYGAAGKALALNGLDNCVYVPNSDSLNIRGATNVTIAAWVKPARVNRASQAIVWKWGWQAQYALCLTNDRVRVVVADATKSLVSQSRLAASQWYHLAGTYDRTEGKLRVYINGILDAERAVALHIPETTEPVYIGKGAFADTSLEGAVDEVRIYGRALSAAEILLLNNSGIWVTQPPVAQTAVWGKNAALRVTALSQRPLAYQWLKDGIPVPGATTDTLALDDVKLTDGGAYSVVISHNLGSVASGPALLSVIPAETAIALYPGVTISGVVGRTYAVQQTTDLNDPASWQTVATVTLTKPVQLWQDTNPADQPKRFYQVIAVP